MVKHLWMCARESFFAALLSIGRFEIITRNNTTAISLLEWACLHRDTCYDLTFIPALWLVQSVGEDMLFALKHRGIREPGFNNLLERTSCSHWNTAGLGNRASNILVKFNDIDTQIDGLYLVVVCIPMLSRWEGFCPLLSNRWLGCLCMFVVGWGWVEWVGDLDCVYVGTWLVDWNVLLASTRWRIRMKGTPTLSACFHVVMFSIICIQRDSIDRYCKTTACPGRRNRGCKQDLSSIWLIDAYLKRLLHHQVQLCWWRHLMDGLLEQILLMA